MRTRAPREWCYETLWEVAKYVFRQPQATVRIHRIEWQRQRFAVRPLEDESTPIYDVWPRMYKPPRRRPEGPPDLDQAPRKRRTKTGGVKIVNFIAEDMGQ